MTNTFTELANTTAKTSPWASPLVGETIGKRVQVPDLTEGFTQVSNLSAAEKMGLGKAEYKKLMEEQIAWEITPAESSRPLISPVELHNQKMAELQQKFKKTDVEFAILKAEQSKWEDTRDSGGVYSKSSPMDLEAMKAASNQNKLDLMIKQSMDGVVVKPNALS